MADRVGFEPTVPFSTSVFKTDAIDHSTTYPMVFIIRLYTLCALLNDMLDTVLLDWIYHCYHGCDQCDALAIHPQIYHSCMHDSGDQKSQMLVYGMMKF